MSRSRSGFALIVVLVVLVTGVVVVALLGRSGKQLFAGDQCTAVVNGADATLDLEQARYASIIVAGSVKHDMPPRAATIALATAFQESGIRNLDHGHHDSLGLFQQRPSMGWGTEAQIMDPYYATDRFYAALAKIADYSDLAVTAAAQRVQRSAYGDAYAKHESRARILASAMTGQTPAAFTCTVAHAGPTWTTGELVDNAGRAFGSRIAASVAAGGATVRVPAASAATAAERTQVRWAVAQWAVANAAQAPIATVRTNNQVWTRTSAADGWKPDPGQRSPGRVTIEVSGP